MKMKKVEAIIRPDKFSDVKQALDSIGIKGITISEVRGHGTQGGLKQQWRGVQYVVDLLPKIRLETVVNDEDVSKVLDAIVGAARTGEIGDGKIFVIPVEDAVRVRTGDKGGDAI